MCGTRTRTNTKYVILKQKIELEAIWRLNQWLCFGLDRYELELGLIFKTTNDFSFFRRIRFPVPFMFGTKIRTKAVLIF
jgi:hypothetical protein